MELDYSSGAGHLSATGGQAVWVEIGTADPHRGGTACRIHVDHQQSGRRNTVGRIRRMAVRQQRLQRHLGADEHHRRPGLMVCRIRTGFDPVVVFRGRGGNRPAGTLTAHPAAAQREKFPDRRVRGRRTHVQNQPLRHHRHAGERSGHRFPAGCRQPRRRVPGAHAGPAIGPAPFTQASPASVRSVERGRQRHHHPVGFLAASTWATSRCGTATPATGRARSLSATDPAPPTW